MRKVPAEPPGDKACVFCPHGPGAHGCSVSEWTKGEALPAAHTHLSAHSGAGAEWASARNDKTGFYKEMRFVPKYLMNMLLK